MKKKILSLLLAIALIITSFAGFGKIESNAYTVTNHQQNEDPWGSVYFDDYTFASSGCGIMSVVNAVHYLTGNWINPIDFANWAHDKGYYTGTDGTYRSMYDNINSKSDFDDKYGFTVTKTAWSEVYDTQFKNHIANGGTAVVHVKGHYMAIVDYNPDTQKFLLWDNAAESAGGYRRPTSVEGDWLTADELEGDLDSTNLVVDWYCLLSATGTEFTDKASVVSGSGKVCFDDNCTVTSLSNVKAGDTVNFRVTPSTGYKCSKIIVGGESLAVKNNGEDCQNYSITQPKKNLSIEVSFEKLPYEININIPTDNGKATFSANASTTYSATMGTKVYFNVKPNTGYKCTKISVDGTDLEIKNEGIGKQTYSFVMLAEDVQIECCFETIATTTPKVTPVATATPTAKPTVTPVATAEITATPVITEEPTPVPTAISTEIPTTTPGLTETPQATEENLTTIAPEETTSESTTAAIEETLKPSEATQEPSQNTLIPKEKEDKADTKNKILIIILLSVLAIAIACATVCIILLLKNRKKAK